MSCEGSGKDDNVSSIMLHKRRYLIIISIIAFVILVIIVKLVVKTNENISTYTNNEIYGLWLREDINDFAYEFLEDGTYACYRIKSYEEKTYTKVKSGSYSIYGNKIVFDNIDNYKFRLNKETCIIADLSATWEEAKIISTYKKVDSIVIESE